MAVETADVIVVGLGAVGAAVLHSLARSGVRAYLAGAKGERSAECECAGVGEKEGVEELGVGREPEHENPKDGGEDEYP